MSRALNCEFSLNSLYYKVVLRSLFSTPVCLYKQTYSKLLVRSFSTFGFSGREPKAFYRTTFPKKFMFETRPVLCVEGSALSHPLSISRGCSSEISSPHFYRQSLGYRVKGPLPLWADRWQWNKGYSTALGSRNFRKQRSQSVLGRLPLLSVTSSSSGLCLDLSLYFV